MNKSLQFSSGARPRPRRISPGTFAGGGATGGAVATPTPSSASTGSASASSVVLLSGLAATATASGGAASTASSATRASIVAPDSTTLDDVLRDLEAASKPGGGAARVARPKKLSTNTATMTTTSNVKRQSSDGLPTAVTSVMLALSDASLNSASEVTGDLAKAGAAINSSRTADIIVPPSAAPSPHDNTTSQMSDEMASAAAAASAAVLKAKAKAARKPSKKANRDKDISHMDVESGDDNKISRASTSASATSPFPRDGVVVQSSATVTTLESAVDIKKVPDERPKKTAAAMAAKKPRKPRAPKVKDSATQPSAGAVEVSTGAATTASAAVSSAVATLVEVATAKMKKPRAPRKKAPPKPKLPKEAKDAKEPKAPKAPKSKTPKVEQDGKKSAGADSAEVDAQGLDFAFASMIAHVQRVRPEPLPVLRGLDDKHLDLCTCLRVVDDDLYFALASELLKVFNLEHRLRRKTQAQLASGQRRNLPPFPATMPASATKEQIQAAIKLAVSARSEPIEEHPLFFSEKNDGVRVFLLFTSLLYFERPMQVVIDRKWDMWLVQLAVPSFFHDGTLLDIELLIDPDRKDVGEKTAAQAIVTKSPSGSTADMDTSSDDATTTVETKAPLATSATAFATSSSSFPVASPKPIVGYKMVILDIVMVYGCDVHEHTHHSRQRIISKLLPCLSLGHPVTHKGSTPITFAQKSWLTLSSANLILVLCRMYASIRPFISSQLNQRLVEAMAATSAASDQTRETKTFSPTATSADGLMLATNHWPLLPGTEREGLLKIKLSSQSTSDLIPLMDPETGLIAICSQEDGVTPLVIARQTPEETMKYADHKTITSVQSMIGHNVAMISTKDLSGFWCAKDIRWDKDGMPPNHISVVKATVKQMQENITYEYLLETLEACEAAAAVAGV
jgi:hypothetical protein